MKMKDILDKIKFKLPYSKPFLFVDELSNISEEGVNGQYTFKEDEYFYKGHFKDNPITPGVILTECLAQIGVVCLGIYIAEISTLEESSDGETIDATTFNTKPVQIALASSQIDFYLPVFPGEKVQVISKKDYFRFGKLKCNVKMINNSGELICKGTISGMIAK